MPLLSSSLEWRQTYRRVSSSSLRPEVDKDGGTPPPPWVPPFFLCLELHSSALPPSPPKAPPRQKGLCPRPAASPGVFLAK